MGPVAVLDACVLYSAPVRDLLIRLAQAELFRARWSELILDECFAAIATTRPELSASALARTRRLVGEAVRGCLVADMVPLAAGVELPDPKDRHVVATALQCRVKLIVTFNERDFPVAALQPLGIKAMHPDAFALRLLAGNSVAFCATVNRQINDLRNPPVTLDELLETFAKCGLGQLAVELRRAGPT